MTTYQDRLRTNVRMSFNSIKTGRFTPVGPYVMTDPGKKTRLSALLFYTKLPRRARDKHRESTQKERRRVFLTEGGPYTLGPRDDGYWDGVWMQNPVVVRLTRSRGYLLYYAAG
jgi:hypothetical protein